MKWKGGAAGRPEIQNLFGARGTDTTNYLFFFAASSYTKAAIEYADYARVSLFIYDPVGVVVPSNTVATEFIQTNDGNRISSFTRMNPVAWLVKSEALFLVGVAVAYALILAIIYLTNLI